MILTIDSIEGALRPVHEAIAKAQDPELNLAGLALHHFIQGAKFVSAKLAQELELRIIAQDQTAGETTATAVADAYHSMLGNLADEAKRHVNKVIEVAGNGYPSVRNACHDAITELDLMTMAPKPRARGNLSEPGNGSGG